MKNYTVYLTDGRKVVISAAKAAYNGMFVQLSDDTGRTVATFSAHNCAGWREGVDAE